jgi:hypothetical protein
MVSRDELRPPAPWTTLTTADDRLEFEREIDSTTDPVVVRLRADRTSRIHPARSETPGWTLRFERCLRRVSSTRAIGAVHSRSEARRSLFGAMRTVNGATRSDEQADGTAGTGHVTLFDRLVETTDRPRRA